MVPLRTLIALAACTAVLPRATAQAQATAPEPVPAPAWSPDVAAANAFARDRPGHVSFSVLDESTGRRWGREAWRRVPSASLLKPLLISAGGSARCVCPAGQVAMKGGWGSGTGAVDHQTALLVRGDRRIVVSITTTGNGSHAIGKATLRGVASRLLRGLD